MFCAHPQGILWFSVGWRQRGRWSSQIHVLHQSTSGWFQTHTVNLRVSPSLESSKTPRFLITFFHSQITTHLMIDLYFFYKGILFLEESHSFFKNLKVFICYSPNILVEQISLANVCSKSLLRCVTFILCKCLGKCLHFIFSNFLIIQIEYLVKDTNHYWRIMIV